MSTNKHKKPRLFFIHTHKIPSGIDLNSASGAVFVVELNSINILDYYNIECQDLNHDLFFDLWPTFYKNLKLPKGFKWLLSMEGLPTTLGLEKHIERYKSCGLRIIQPFHWMETPYIDKSGLTSYGEQLLFEMQALDLILDVSHMAGPLLAEVLRKYSGKIIASHVVLRDILKSKCPRSNSLSKEELLALANRSALIGVPFVNDLVDPYGAQPDGTYTGRLLDLLKQIKAITDVVGVENVAIGPDFFNFSYYSRRLNLTLRPIENLDTNSGLRRLESELLKSGFSENDIDRIMFLNAELFFKNYILNN